MQELASELSITCSAAKARFFRAKEMLKTRMVTQMSRSRPATFPAPIIPIAPPPRLQTGQGLRASASHLTRDPAFAETA